MEYIYAAAGGFEPVRVGWINSLTLVAWAQVKVAFP
jgi:hypothetical protein